MESVFLLCAVQLLFTQEFCRSLVLHVFYRFVQAPYVMSRPDNGFLICPSLPNPIPSEQVLDEHLDMGRLIGDDWNADKEQV